MLFFRKIRRRACLPAAVALLTVWLANAGWASDAETLNPCERRSNSQERVDSHSTEWSKTSPAHRHESGAAVGAGFCPPQFAQDFFRDQKAIWTSPFHLHSQDKNWLAPLAVGTFSLMAGDENIMRHFGNSPVAHSSSFSNYGLAAMIGGAATLYLRVAATHDKQSRETGFLAGEAAVDGVIVAETMKLAFQRPRPNEANAGTFGGGGRVVSLRTCGRRLVDRKRHRPGISRAANQTAGLRGSDRNQPVADRGPAALPFRRGRRQRPWLSDRPICVPGAS